MNLIYKPDFETFLPPPDFSAITKIFIRMIDTINDDFELSDSFVSINTVINFQIADIQKVIQLDTRTDPVQIYFEDQQDTQVKIITDLKHFHLYWCHQLNLLPALAAGKIKTGGPLDQIMALGQMVDQARKIYVTEYRKINTG